jgi:hypothetical protein
VSLVQCCPIMALSNGPPSITDMPTEVHSEVISYLNFIDFTRYRQTCHLLYDSALLATQAMARLERAFAAAKRLNVEYSERQTELCRLCGLSDSQLTAISSRLPCYGCLKMVSGDKVVTSPPWGTIWAGERGFDILQSYTSPITTSQEVEKALTFVGNRKCVSCLRRQGLPNQHQRTLELNRGAAEGAAVICCKSCNSIEEDVPVCRGSWPRCLCEHCHAVAFPNDHDHDEYCEETKMSHHAVQAKQARQFRELFCTRCMQKAGNYIDELMDVWENLRTAVEKCFTGLKSCDSRTFKKSNMEDTLDSLCIAHNNIQTSIGLLRSKRKSRRVTTHDRVKTVSLRQTSIKDYFPGQT